MNTFVLTMVLMIPGHAMTSFTQEYTSKQKCEEAKAVNREALTNGNIVLATCTAK